MDSGSCIGDSYKNAALLSLLECNGIFVALGTACVGFEKCMVYTFNGNPLSFMTPHVQHASHIDMTDANS